MRSKPILLSVLFSTIVLSLSFINVGYKLPIKAEFNSLSETTKRQVTCLAENIYFEAGNEPENGKRAVAFVTINRVQSGNYGKDICGVVHQKTGSTCQFSWLCDKKITDKRLTIRSTSLYNEVRELAINMLINYEFQEDVTSGATYYHADYVNPGWKLKKVEKIGRHIFYKSDKDKIDKNKEII